MGNEGYKRIIDKQSRIYDKQRVKHYFKKTIRDFLRIIPRGKSVLDVGSGTGLYVIEFIKKGRPAVGLDYHRKMIDISKKNAKHAGVKADFILCDVEENVPLNQRFDYALFVGNWEYFDNPVKVLLNVKRVLRDGGKVIISTPNMLAYPIIVLLEKLGLKLAPAFWHFNSIPSRIKGYAKEAGFFIEGSFFNYYFFDKVYMLKNINI